MAARKQDLVEVAAVEEDLLENDLVDRATLSTTLPLIKGARVVYLGGNPHYSITVMGRLMVDTVLDEESEGGEVVQLKTCVEEGSTPYDFSDLDSKKRRIKLNRFPSTAPAAVANKRFLWCEHPEHLRKFHRGEVVGRESPAEKARMFRVLVPPEVRPIWIEYVQRVERWSRRKSAQVQETRTEG